MLAFDIIAFDADDTLWDNERMYIGAQKKFTERLSQYHARDWIQSRLDQTESRNLQHFGYGIKSFALSMIETAVELTEGRITGQDIQYLLDLTKEMITMEVQLFEGVADTLAALARTYPLMVITKGDLFDQENKLARSGLLEYFKHIEIVSAKTPQTYSRILMRYQVKPERFLMVGNALRSDILPVLEIGGHAVYVPYEATWTHETTDPPPADQPRYYQIEHLALLPQLLDSLENSGKPL